MKKDLTILALLMVILFLLSLGKVDARDCVAYCIGQAESAYAGKPIDKPMDCGGDIDGKALCNSGGSQNWPLNCNLAKSLKNNKWSWWNGYYDEMIRNKRFGCKEFASPIYYQNNLADVLVMFVKGNDPEAKEKARKYLRTNWALFALTANTRVVKQIELRWSDQTKKEVLKPSPISGYRVNIAGVRSGRGGDFYNVGSLHQVMFNVALNHPARGFAWSVHQSPGWYWPLKNFARGYGFHIPADGKVKFKSKVIPAEKFGITEAERATIVQHINSDGKERLDDILAMIDDDHVPVEGYHFIRTTNGTTVWFDKSFNGNKPPTMLTFMNDSRTLYGLQPYYSCGVGCPSGKFWREGDKICGTGHPQYTRCIPVATGELIYEIDWNREGIFVKYPAPTPTPSPTIAPTPEPTPPPVNGTVKTWWIWAGIGIIIGLIIIIVAARKP